jgi:hypothetical protein
VPKTIEPLDVSALETAVNHASSRAAGLWITFLSLATYLAIAVGSVTHRMLLLETPTKLPLLNIDLPLAAFFAVAPVFFVIFILIYFFSSRF